MHWKTLPRWWKAGAPLLAVIGLMLPPEANALSPRECRDWFARADQALEAAGIQDAGAHRIESYPHLRANRWLAAIRPAAGNAAAGAIWLRLLARQAREGWHSELLRLAPAANLRPAGRRARVQRMRTCIEALLKTTAHANVPELEIPDSYSGLQRALGLYPLTSLLVRPAIHDYRRDMARRFHAPAPEPVRVFTPPQRQSRPPRPESLRHALKLPLPGKGARQALLKHYAPVLAVARSDPANIPGTLGLANGRPAVLTRTTTAYHWLSWTRFQGERLLQLNYQFWFTRRPGDGGVDPYAGRLDGLIWRVTLRPNGNVLTYDSIHPCGCYHKVYPVDPAIQARKPDQAGQPVYYPRRAPNARAERVQLTLAPDIHYVVDVAPYTTDAPQRRYRLRPADTLRRLPDGRGYGSLYDNQGLVPATRRGERWYLWPLGVPSAGAMRQPGHHAIAFIGKRHFDDPDVLEQVLKPRTYPR